MKKIKILIVAILTVILVGCLVGTQFLILEVEGPSMKSSIAPGELVIVKKGTKCERGTIIVFKHKQKKLIKRVVAVDGDRVEARHGFLFVNNKRVKESYTTGKTKDVYCTVPDGKVFVLGDNREHSIDSRLIGCIKKESIVGRVLFNVG